MKKVLILAGLMGAILVPSLAGALSRFGGEWTTEPTKKFGDYGSVEIKLSMDGYKAMMKGKKDELNALEKGDVVIEGAKKYFDKWAAKFKGKAGGPKLVIEVDLEDFWSNGAAKFLGGIPGHIDHVTTLKDGATVIAVLETKYPSNSRVASDAARAAQAICKYIDKKR